MHPAPRRTPRQRHPPGAAGVQRCPVHSLVSRGEVARRCAGPTDATCDTHTPPAAQQDHVKTREGGTFPVTGRRHYRQPWQRPPPSEITPAKSSAANIQIAKPLPICRCRTSDWRRREEPPTSVAADSLGQEACEGEVVATWPGGKGPREPSEQDQSPGRQPQRHHNAISVDRGSRLGRPGDGPKPPP